MVDPIIRKSTDEMRANLIHQKVRKAGLRGKIDAKCIECLYDPYQSGTWVKQVAECTSLTCPLYTVRKRSSKES